MICHWFRTDMLWDFFCCSRIYLICNLFKNDEVVCKFQKIRYVISIFLQFFISKVRSLELRYWLGGCILVLSILSNCCPNKQKVSNFIFHFIKIKTNSEVLYGFLDKTLTKLQDNISVQRTWPLVQSFVKCNLTNWFL